MQLRQVAVMVKQPGANAKGSEAGVVRGGGPRGGADPATLDPIPTVRLGSYALFGFTQGMHSRGCSGEGPCGGHVWGKTGVALCLYKAPCGWGRLLVGAHHVGGNTCSGT